MLYVVKLALSTNTNTNVSLLGQVQKSSSFLEVFSWLLIQKHMSYMWLRWEEKQYIHQWIPVSYESSLIHYLSFLHSVLNTLQSETCYIC